MIDNKLEMRFHLEHLVIQDRRRAFYLAAVLIGGIAFTDWLTALPFSLGLLYLFPMVLAAPSLERVEIAAMSVACAFLQELFSGFPTEEQYILPSLLVALSVYLGVGLLVWEIARRGRNALGQSRKLADEVRVREAAEEQAHRLIEDSPAAMLVVDPEGTVALANQAAHELLKCAPGGLAGQPIAAYLPVVASLRQTSRVRHLVRTMIESTGRRQTGETFLAHVWVSSYGPPSATSLNLVVVDSSEQLRDREEVGLRTLATSARVIMGAYWHETQNFCTAMRVTAAGLKALPGIAETEEMAALNSLLAGLEKLSTAELQPESERSLDSASLRAVLDHLRVVVEPWFEEEHVEMEWRLADNLPLVRADHHGILQVFLNLSRNALRALEDAGPKRFSVSASVEDRLVVVRFRNTGRPVARPDLLFAPFQPEASGRGIGMYVSRAIVRSFGGDLRYEPSPGGSCFAVVLEPGALSYLYRDR